MSRSRRLKRQEVAEETREKVVALSRSILKGIRLSIDPRTRRGGGGLLPAWVTLLEKSTVELSLSGRGGEGKKVLKVPLDADENAAGVAVKPLERVHARAIISERERERDVLNRKHISL